VSALESAAPAIAMLAAFALIAGGVVVIRRGDNRRQGVLMLVMAIVLIGNVVIWTL